jgi:hypothetical protein
MLSAMDDDTFWQLIAECTPADDDPDAVELAEALTERLTAESVETVIGFAEQLAWVLYRLDRREYAEAGGGDYVYVSADGFLYARAAVVAGGREVYDQVLQDPTLFAPYNDELIWAEPLLTVPDVAYQNLTGEEWNRETRYSYESFSNHDGWLDKSAR